MSDEEYKNLSLRAKNVLAAMGIHSAKEFKTPTKEEILKTRNGGMKTISELNKLGYIKKSTAKKK